MIIKIEQDPFATLRAILQEAENAGNVALIAPILADDITVIAPVSTVINGKTDAVAFLKSWFEAFVIRITYTKVSSQIEESLAYEWAVYQQETTDRSTGEKAAETGRILWVYKKYDGQWLQLVIWNTL